MSLRASRAGLFSGLAFGLTCCVLPLTGHADFSISSPNNSTVSQCADFASETFGDPWDFSSPTDLPQSIKPLMYQQITDPPIFSGGALQFTTSGQDPYFTLLTPHVPLSIAVPQEVRYGANTPIDVSRYNTFSIRMFTDQASFFQVFWNSDGSSFAITDPVNTEAGVWKTYTVDLRNIGINQHGGGSYLWSASNKTHLRIDPTGISGANILVDGIQLTKAESDCPQVTTTFTGSNNTVAAIYLDDDTDIANGFQQHTTVSTTGSSQSANFSTAKLFPGTLKVYGYETTDFGALLGNPFDFSDSADVDSSRIFNLTNTSFDGSRYCATTTSDDGNFYLKFPQNKGIDASKFRYVYFKLAINNGNDILFPNLVWENQSRAVLGQVIADSFDPNTGLVTFDMAGESGWTGEIYGLRIQATKVAGVSYCVDWVSVSTATRSANDQPSIPSLVHAPGTVPISSPSSLALIQPDKRGGRDCPTHYLNNPWTMNNQSDVQGLENVTGAQFRPHNTVTDSRGVARTGDFLRGISLEGSDDPKVHPLLFSNSLNADTCVNLCYSLILNRTPEIYHSVARFTYLDANGAPQNGDDIINPDRWAESDVCVYLKELQQEPPLTPGVPHPWAGNLNFISVDPLEDRNATEFFLDYVELREDHKARDQFAVVVNAATSKTVELFASTAKPGVPGQLPSGAFSIGSLSASRSSNVFLWNTSAVSAGRYYVTARIDSNTYPVIVTSILPVSISQSNEADITAPIHLIDSPVDGRQVTNALQVAGAVFDDVSHAITEVHIDGVYQQGIVPNIFHKGAREQYPALAPDKPGFNVFVDVANLSAGTHQLELRSYDTSGNVKTYTASFVKGATSDPDVTYPDANSSPVDFGTPDKTLTINVVNNANLTVVASGYEGCTSTSVIASKTSDLSDFVTMFNGIGSTTRTAMNVYQWIATGAATSDFSAAARKKKPKCKKKKVCTGKGKRRKCRIKKVCTPQRTPVPTPTATPTPAPEDGTIYFQARCDGGSASNVVSVDFAGKISNTGKVTSAETLILQDLQTQLTQSASTKE